MQLAEMRGAIEALMAQEGATAMLDGLKALVAEWYAPLPFLTPGLPRARRPSPR
jgi:hypothetical protein